MIYTCAGVSLYFDLITLSKMLNGKLSITYFMAYDEMCIKLLI